MDCYKKLYMRKLSTILDLKLRRSLMC